MYIILSIETTVYLYKVHQLMYQTNHLLDMYKAHHLMYQTEFLLIFTEVRQMKHRNDRY